MALTTDTSNDKVLDEALYSKIDSNVRERFSNYCYKAKILKIDAVNNQRKLIEIALTQYMDANPLPDQTKVWKSAGMAL